MELDVGSDPESDSLDIIYVCDSPVSVEWGDSGGRLPGPMTLCDGDIRDGDS